MVLEKLDIAFHPESIAVVGTSGNPQSLGHSFLEHLVNYGYMGTVYPVTRNWPEILGLKTYPALKDVPGPVDYVICCLPAAHVPQMLKECPDKGVKVVHMFTGRFSETGREDAANLEKEILALAQELDVRLIGPNCMGVYNPRVRVASGYDFPMEAGNVGLFLQSGSASSEVVYYGSRRGLRFSKVISYGNALDINESDILEYLAQDDETDIIASYIEGMEDGRRFLQVLRQAARSKPVITLKAGRGKAGTEMAASHTAAMAGSLKIWEAAMKQAGAVQAQSLEDMVDLIVSFDFLPPILGNRVGIVSGGGGNSVLSADEWEEAGFEVAPLPREIEEMIREEMPKLWWGWVKNPLDVSLLPQEALFGNFSGNMLKMMSQSEGYDLVAANLPIGGPFSKGAFAEYVRKQVENIIQAKKGAANPIVAVFSTGSLRAVDLDDERWRVLTEAMPQLTDAGVPVYSNALQAAGAIMRLIKYYQRRNEDL